MSWLLDTNACIRYLNGRAPKLKIRLDAAQPADIFVSSIVKAELFFGAAKSNDPALTLAKQKKFLAPFAITTLRRCCRGTLRPHTATTRSGGDAYWAK
jgi:predicted nucleic acid-binding protein